MHAVPVFAFLDFTSPFCYVAEAVLRRLEAEGAVEVRPRAWEQHPAPAPLPPADAATWNAAAVLAREEAIHLAPPPAPVRTAKAHEAALFAEQHGAGGPLRAAIFRAYCAEGRDIGRIDVLVELGTGVGLDPSELRVVLDVDALSARVAWESAEGRRIGITHVPALIIGGDADARLLLGPQSSATIRAALPTQPLG